MPQVAEHIAGRAYWLSVQHLADTEAIQQRIADEFADYDPEELRSMSRRRFLQLAAASMALAGLTMTGCRRYPEEKLAPFAARPDGYVPGTTQRYATMMELGGVATGLHATSFDGRPIKLDGNPLHPVTQGASDVQTQAAILDLYDPDRARHVVDRRGEQPQRRNWAAFADELKALLATHREADGKGLAVLSEATGSLTIRRLREQFVARFPEATWHTWEPIDRSNAYEGSRLAFGEVLRPVLQLDRAKLIVSFDADLLGAHPGKLMHARGWAAGRRSADEGEMNRMLIAEAGFSTTGSVADARMAARPAVIEQMLEAVQVLLASPDAAMPTGLGDREAGFARKIVRELRGAGRDAVVAVGDRLSPQAHALGHAINMRLQNTGRTVRYISEPTAGDATLAELATAINAGNVDTLLVVGGNPAFDAPADVGFGDLLGKVKTTAHLSTHSNETSMRCTWLLPRAHFLETWSDGVAWDGAATLGQPLIQPLMNGKSAAEVLAMLLGEDDADGYALIRDTFRSRIAAVDFDKQFKQLIHDGIAPTLNDKAVTPRPTGGDLSLPTPVGEGHFDVVFAADSEILDGRFANNGWLQELPNPMTKVTWDNPLLMAKADADAAKLTTGDMVTLTVGKQSMQLPVYVMPGQPRGVLTVTFGHGRESGGRIGSGIGFNTYPLRSSDVLHTARASIAKTGRRYTLAQTQDHFIMDDVGAWGVQKRVGKQGESGKIIKDVSLDEYNADPHVVHAGAHGHGLPIFQPPSEFNEPHAWGMAIDMNSCTGCNACTIACQAENNIPVVGKEEVNRSREMHWLRIDRYFKGDPDSEDLDVAWQPMACVHCETAPCEQVCPVAATVHDTEGLNTMVYNRCIGTRYCSNNCPYKVRRFNYHDYQSKPPNEAPEGWYDMPDTQQRNRIDLLRRMAYNPDVTVRMRGVMEKCTYCTQRIAKAKIDAKNEWTRGDREDYLVHDGEVVTACQEACPTQAIVFGNLNDPNSKVSQLHRSNRTYAVLDNLNTRPRTKYLAKIRNPMPGDAPTSNTAKGGDA